MSRKFDSFDKRNLQISKNPLFEPGNVAVRAAIRSVIWVLVAGILGGMATLERAIAIAAEHHAGQVDLAGQPYILHPINVMLRGETDDQRIVGVLHDVVEDTPVTLEDLRAEGFSDGVVEAVDLLTKRPGESRLEAARRAAPNPLARFVKLVDNAENSDLSRIGEPTAKDYARLEEYRQVRSVLLDAEKT